MQTFGVLDLDAYRRLVWAISVRKCTDIGIRLSELAIVKCINALSKSKYLKLWNFQWKAYIKFISMFSLSMYLKIYNPEGI